MKQFCICWERKNKRKTRSEREREREIEKKKRNRHWLKWNNLYWWFWSVHGGTSIINLLSSLRVCVSTLQFAFIRWCCVFFLLLLVVVDVEKRQSKAKEQKKLSYRTKKNHALFIDFIFYEWLNGWHNENAWVILEWVIFLNTLLRNLYFIRRLLESMLYTNKI